MGRYGLVLSSCCYLCESEEQDRSGCEAWLGIYMLSKNTLEQAKALWKRRYNEDLTDDSTRQIVENVVGFFRLLHEWELQSHSLTTGDAVMVTSDCREDM